MSWYVVVLGAFWVWLYVPRMIAWVLWRVAPNRAAKVGEFVRRAEEAWRSA